MANMDFVSYPLGEYTMNNINFVNDMKEVPKVFSTNYFLRNPDGKFCTDKLAKKVWLHWAEGRVHGEYDAVCTPTGKIPLYEDLKVLFKKFLDIDYTSEITPTSSPSDVTSGSQNSRDQKHSSQRWMPAVLNSCSPNGMKRLPRSKPHRRNMVIRSNRVHTAVVMKAAADTLL